VQAVSLYKTNFRQSLLDDARSCLSDFLRYKWLLKHKTLKLRLSRDKKKGQKDVMYSRFYSQLSVVGEPQIHHVFLTLFLSRLNVGYQTLMFTSEMNIHLIIDFNPHTRLAHPAAFLDAVAKALLYFPPSESFQGQGVERQSWSETLILTLI
jgi:hypothetical protein